MAKNTKVAVVVTHWAYGCECGDDHSGTRIEVKRNGNVVADFGGADLVWPELARDLARVLGARVHATCELVGDDEVLKVSYAPGRTLKIRVSDEYVSWGEDQPQVIADLLAFVGASDATVVVAEEYHP